MTRENFITEATALGVSEEDIAEILAEADKAKENGEEYPFELILLSRGIPPLETPRQYPPSPVYQHK